MNSIHVIIIFIFSIILSSFIIKEYFIIKKSKFLKFNSKIEKSFFKSKISEIDKKLKSLNNPYGLNIKNYIIIKYILSIIIFILSIFRSQSFLLSIFFFLIIFFIPNLLIKSFYQKENTKIINDLIKINNFLILSLSAKMSFINSFRISLDLISYNRLKKELNNFYDDYKIYNFNINKAINNINNKFNSSELKMFLNTLSQGEKEGNFVENLNAFGETLELMYFKCLKANEVKRILFLTMSSIFIIFNLILIVLYPIIFEIIENFKGMFS